MKPATIMMLVLALTVVAAPAAADDAPSGFAALWKKHQAGQDVREALRMLERDVTRPRQERFNAAYLGAVIHLARNEPSQALERLDVAEQTCPDAPQVAVRRAEAFLQQGKAPGAAKELKRVLSVAQKDRKSAVYRQHQIMTARVEARAGSPKKAIARLKKLARIHERNWDVRFFLGQCYEATDDPQNAMAAYETTIQYLPKTDPVIGVYAFQRWAALAISSDGSSYGKPELLAKAVERYKAFLDRAKANHVPRELVENVKRTVGVLEHFGR